MIALANVLTLAGCYLLYKGLWWLDRAYGDPAALMLAGVIAFAIICHQIWHKRRYGCFWDGPVVNSDPASPPTAAGESAKLLDKSAH